jgi:hypothetical protein
MPIIGKRRTDEWLRGQLASIMLFCTDATPWGLVMWKYDMKSTKELVNELRTAPGPWMDVAIVVAFDNRFEFVTEDHPDPTGRLNFLQEQGGLAVGLACVKPNPYNAAAFFTKVFPEYEGQAWAHRCMDTLRRIVRRQSLQVSGLATSLNGNFHTDG